MRYVRQKHAKGCGVASLAMVTGNSYDRVMGLVAPNRQKGEMFIGTALEDALRTLNNLGVKYRIHFDTRLSQIKNDAYIAARLPCGCRHAVAWDAKNKKILDPDTTDMGHDGERVQFSRKYVEKNLNYIVEIIPS